MSTREQIQNYRNAVDGIRENIVNVRTAHGAVGATRLRQQGYDETLEQIEDLTESLVTEIEDDLATDLLDC